MIRTAVVLVIAVDPVGVRRPRARPATGSDRSVPTIADPGAARVVGGPDLDEHDRPSLQAACSDVPGDAPGWATLALAYVEQARVSGDASLLRPGDGCRAHDRWRSSRRTTRRHWPPARPSTAARHDFSGCARAGRPALAIDPYRPGALAIRVDALTELGRYDAQLRPCGRPTAGSLGSPSPPATPTPSSSAASSPEPRRAAAGRGDTGRARTAPTSSPSSPTSSDAGPARPGRRPPA